MGHKPPLPERSASGEGEANPRDAPIAPKNQNDEFRRLMRRLLRVAPEDVREAERKWRADRKTGEA